MCYSMLKGLFALISVLQIPLGNICILRNQNTFALGLHLMKYLTLKAIAVPVQLQFRENWICCWCYLHVNVHLHSGPSTEV